jgi:putative FmdB family regulatory protein
MPLYEYGCQECGKQAELLVTSRAQPACPECGSVKLTKLLSIVAAPTRNGTSGDASAKPSGGSCGSHCACHPHG